MRALFLRHAAPPHSGQIAGAGQKLLSTARASTLTAAHEGRYAAQLSEREEHERPEERVADRPESKRRNWKSAGGHMPAWHPGRKRQRDRHGNEERRRISGVRRTAVEREQRPARCIPLRRLERNRLLDPRSVRPRRCREADARASPPQTVRRDLAESETCARAIHPSVASRVSRRPAERGAARTSSHASSTAHRPPAAMNRITVRITRSDGVDRIMRDVSSAARRITVVPM